MNILPQRLRDALDVLLGRKLAREPVVIERVDITIVADRDPERVARGVVAELASLRARRARSSNSAAPPPEHREG